MPPKGGQFKKLEEQIVRMCNDINTPKKDDKDSVKRFVARNLDTAIGFLEKDLNFKLKGTAYVKFIQQTMIQFYLKEKKEKKQKKKNKPPRDWYPDDETLHNAVVKWCSKVKEKPKDDNQFKVKKWVYNNVASAIEQVEENLKMEEVGLGLSREFIQQVMIEYFLCGYKTIDVKKPEPCMFCAAPEIVEDGKNWKECVYACEAQFPIPKKDPDDTTEPQFVKTCKTPACCYKCSGLPDGWNWELDPFYCKKCNRPEIIKQTEMILAGQEIVDIFTPPEDEEDLDGPVFSKVKKPVQGVRVKDAMGGGGKTITQKKAREMLGMDKGIPSFAGLDLCADPRMDMCGNLEATPLLKARKPPPPEVFVCFLEQYQKYDIAEKWHEKNVLVKDVKAEMIRMYHEAKGKMVEGQAALDYIKEDMTIEEEQYDNGEKPNSKDPMRAPYLKKRLQIVEKKIEEKHPTEYKSLSEIESTLTMIRELLRIVKNKLTKKNFEAIETKLDEFWKSFDCSDIEDDEDLSSGSDSSSDEDECDVDANS